MSTETSSSLSNSSALSSLPPPIRYFDLLPPELVLKIVEEAGSARATWDDPDKEDKTTLCILCLTSKRLRSVALPRLLRHLAWPYDTRWSRLECLVNRNPPEVFSSIRRIDLRHRCFDDSDLARLATLAQAASSLAECSCMWAFPHLQPFLGSNITTLSISSIAFPEDSFFSFPQLRRLYVVACQFGDRGGGGGIRFNLPSVRHLVYSAPLDGPYDDQIPLLECIASTLLSVTTSPESAAVLPPSILSSASINLCYDPELQDFASCTEALDRIEHLRLRSFGLDHRGRDEDALLVAEHLETWTHLLSRAAKLKTLFLPLVPKDVTIHQSIQPRLAALLAACQCLHINVIEEARLPGINFWHSVSPSFIKISEDRRA